LKVLVSAGPTREFFDTIRFISNPSSGKMGYAIAREATRRGHEVTLVSGPVSLKPPKDVETVQVTSAAEMYQACKKVYQNADVGIMCAAVCDYRPCETATQKMEKKARNKRVSLEPTEDIALELGKRKGKRLLIGFALQDHDPYQHAERKLEKKNFDLIVLNGPDNVGTDQAMVELYTPAAGWTRPIIGTKAVIARRLLKTIESMREPH
jgi:phosphopantothenoylcysteine decarboxylase/phosphopantothenate--cysteine ligase